LLIIFSFRSALLPMQPTSYALEYFLSITSTDNDEAIARALAHEDQVRFDRASASANNGSFTIPPAPAARRPVVIGNPVVPPHSSSVVRRVNCPGSHGLNEFLVSYAQRVECKLCHRTLQRDERPFGCVICQFDVCQSCVSNPPPSYVPPRQATSSTTQQRFPLPPPQQSFGRPANVTNQTHMCIAPCILGDGICVEMLVDTGAQSSVISISLARQLGLEGRIDRTQRGIAAGVGRAHIMGKIHNAVCSLGHVEFPMDFIVLDMDDKLLLLGLELMRKYKCIVDLERDVLIFGGRGGVEVPLLPADEQHVSLRNTIGCPLS